jgi:hypothetical protein
MLCNCSYGLLWEFYEQCCVTEVMAFYGNFMNSCVIEVMAFYGNFIRRFYAC